MGAPAFAGFESIYPGPFVDDEGYLDERVWFRIPISVDADTAALTYLVFPYGASEEDINEVTIELTAYV